MSPQVHAAPWHRESYDNFISQRLPELVAARLPLQSYDIASGDGPSTYNLDLVLDSPSGPVELRIADIPRPNAEGVFYVDDTPLIVLPAASCADFDQAEIRCVGEQLYDFIEPRLGEAPPDLAWDEELAASWLLIDRWVREYLGQWPFGQGPVQRLSGQNWLSRHEHLRQIFVDVSPGSPALGGSGQLGRICPFLTPEGPSIGRIRSLARGASIEEGRIVPSGEAPIERLSLTVSMIPCLEHDDTNRTLMGGNLMRRWEVIDDPEPALVQTGLEPQDPDFWCGKNLLTAFVSWGPGTVEDGIIVSESCAKRFCVEGILEPGDKISNRHGTKGVISVVLPDEEMPHLEDGTAVDLVFSFLGLHTRMNHGQVREAVLGRIAEAEGAPVLAPPFGGPDKAEIRARLAKAGLPESGMTLLREGKGGPALDRPSTAGRVYWGVSHHLARRKLQAFVNAAQNGRVRGQSIGELEYCALKDAGAFDTILEDLNTLACDREGIEDIAEEIARRDVSPAEPPTPRFKWLQTRLAMASIEMRFEGEAVRFAMCAPPGDALQLAEPVPHPWLRGQMLTEVGRETGLAEWPRLEAVNEQLGRILKGKAPASLVTRTRDKLIRHLEAYFEALLRQEGCGAASAGLNGGLCCFTAASASSGMYRGRVSLGGRVCFSGRSVITPGVGLGVDQVGVPEAMAWALFGPKVMRVLGDRAAVEERTEAATRQLDAIMADSWAVAQRSPSLTPTSLIAFRPMRVAGNAIRLNPLVCLWMNADFDGDQLALFVPVTAQAQEEAGAKLSVAGHLRRAPNLIDSLFPPMESLWGLAYLSLQEEGRRTLKECVDCDLAGPDGFVTRDSLTQAMRGLLQREGEARVLEVLERLMALGFAAAKRSGASMNPFAGTSLPPLECPAPLTAEDWFDYADEVDDLILSRQDYDSLDIGPQLLAVKSGARGRVDHIRSLMMGAAITDEAMGLHFVGQGFVEGLEAEQLFMWTIGALRGLNSVATNTAQMGVSRCKSCAGKGFSVLARALRSRSAGPVLARAAANNEVDPLTDIDARLFVGLKP